MKICENSVKFVKNLLKHFHEFSYDFPEKWALIHLKVYTTAEIRECKKLYIKVYTTRNGPDGVQGCLRNYPKTSLSRGFRRFLGF